MYSIMHLSSKSRQSLSAILTSGVNTKPIFSLALGYVIARPLSLPPQGSENALDYLRLQHEFNNLELISAINEFTPFNLKETQAAIRAFYMYRHNAVTMPVVPLCFSTFDGIKEFFGLQTIFSNDSLKIIDETGWKLSEMIARLNDVVAELQKAGQQNLDLDSDLKTPNN